MAKAKISVGKTRLTKTRNLDKIVIGISSVSIIINILILLKLYGVM